MYYASNTFSEKSFEKPTEGSLKSVFSNSGVKTQLDIPLIPYVSISSKSTQLSSEEIRVDMANVKIEKRPIWLVTNVGSCVAICLHDTINKCGGLAHIMLPYANGNSLELPYKYANTAVPTLAESIRKMNNDKVRLIAKIAGGASMFSDIKCHLINIGRKNVDAVKESLKANNIPLLAEDVGGNHGRKVSFNTATGTMVVRSLKGVEKFL